MMLADSRLRNRPNVLLQSVPCQNELWDRWHKEHDHASDHRHAKEIRNCFLVKLGGTAARVLEVGCGQGRDAIAFAEAGLDVVALDYSSVALARAQTAYLRVCGQMTDTAYGRVDWCEHDYGAEGITAKGELFDAVYSHLSLHYFDNEKTRRLFEDIARVLRPDGLLFCTVRSHKDELFEKGYSVNGEPEYRCYRGHVRRFFSEEYLADVLSGWRDLNLRTYIPNDSTVNPGTFIRVMARRPQG